MITGGYEKLTLGLPHTKKNSKGESIVGKGFGVSELRNAAEALQAHATPHKPKIVRWAENKPLLNILCIFLYRLTIFCEYRSLVVKSIRS